MGTNIGTSVPIAARPMITGVAGALGQGTDRVRKPYRGTKGYNTTTIITISPIIIYNLSYLSYSSIVPINIGAKRGTDLGQI